MRRPNSVRLNAPWQAVARAVLAAVVGAGWLWLAAAAGAAEDGGPDIADTRDRLRTIERAIDVDRRSVDRLDAQAATVAAELVTIRDEMVRAASNVQGQEALVDRVVGQLDTLAREADAKEHALVQRRRELGGTLAALQRLALRPPAALLTTPGNANDVVRSGLLLRTAVPRIEHQATALRGDLEALRAVRALMNERGSELEQAMASLVRERDRLGALVARKTALLNQTREEMDAAEDRVARLALQALDLDGLLTRLEQDRLEREQIDRVRREQVRRDQEIRQPAPRGATAPVVTAPVSTAPVARPGPLLNGAPISDARGTLAPPVRGLVVQRFGETTPFGGTSRGIKIQPSGTAQVVAPWDGEIVFAGEFADFGRILIIEHGEGYHSLLAGLERIDADVGQRVLSGEPVGIVGNGQAISPAESSDDGRILYVELRRRGQPINPLPWLAASKDRVRG